jgi:hypothetical protein
VKIAKLSQFIGGWFIGNFDPAIVKTETFEACVKRYKAGSSEATHFQRVAWEVTVVVDGKCMLGGQELSSGDIVKLEPLESASFEAITDCIVVAIKSPSMPADKVIGEVQ